MAGRFIVAATILVLAIVLFSSNKQLTSSGPISFNQNYIESANIRLDLEDADAIFWYVFSSLPDEVTVYPTENYYYFTFYANGKNIWGNIRLGVEDRENGETSFAYWEFRENPQKQDGDFSQHKMFSADDGLAIAKINNLKYKVSYNNKEVVFNLNRLPQTPPKIAKLRDSEVFVQRTLDESGFPLFLIFDEKDRSFMWVLDEERKIPDDLVANIDDSELGLENVVFGKRSRFAFYNDKENNRKILIGVDAYNIRKNNYFDGPFDQLADNYVDDQSMLASYIENAYPYTRGRIDKYGKFTDHGGSRMAISPYYEYFSLYDFSEFVNECEVGPPEELYQCLTYDYKESVPAAEPEPADPIIIDLL